MSMHILSIHIWRANWGPRDTALQPGGGAVRPTGPGSMPPPRRFYGSVEIGMIRTVKAFDPERL